MLCQHKRVVIRTKFVRYCLQTHPAHLTTIHYLQLIQLLKTYSLQRGTTLTEYEEAASRRRRGAAARYLPKKAAGASPTMSRTLCTYSGRREAITYIIVVPREWPTYASPLCPVVFTTWSMTAGKSYAPISSTLCRRSRRLG